MKPQLAEAPHYTATQWREAIISAASELARVALSYPSASACEQASLTAEASAQIALVGRPSYSLSLAASNAGCAALATAVLGMDIAGFPAQVVADALGELVNMLAGGVKRRLPGGTELELGLPVYSTGVPQPSDRQSTVVVPLQIGPVEVCVMVIGPKF